MYTYISESYGVRFLTKTYEKLKHWKLWKLSRSELYKKGYDNNVYYSLECLKKQCKYWKENKSYQCPVCYKDTGYPLVYMCGHGLCSECDRRLIKKECPICRACITNRIKFNLKI